MIRIFTDTSANLPETLSESNGLTVLPFHYTMDGQEIAGDAPFDGSAFYDAMRNGADVSTSMIRPHDFTEAFAAALDAGDDLVYVGMSGGISGSFQASLTALKALQTQYPQRRMEAVDTCAASLGEGFAALFAGRLAAAGEPFDSLVKKVRGSCRAMCQFFTVDDLHYLRRGGRISKVRAVVGSLLNIKPILCADEDGRIVLDHKARGRRSAIERLAEEFDRRVTDRAAPVGIAHADCPEDAALLAALLTENGLTGNILTVCYEPVTGAHVGPGALALFFYGTRS